MPSHALAQAIQLSLAPVFLLASMSGLLMVLTNRLTRLIDRARVLQEQGRDSGQDTGRSGRLELQGQKQRMGLILKAIGFCTVTMLLVALVVAIVFISVVAQIDLALVVVPLFVLAMLCLMVAVLLFLREVQLATAQLRRSF
ncbi:DUF2721 domain-containing protein [Cyanobium sp. FACHB-13342]|uniref:DUF2721 domain-containing protein n=1 Tax=Cyanobium sp. FACHB-13342 TaxID=2692793 RepID=UPI001680F49C|nr:DUF2721 domain-containing protein [Cyanobium sp. FACHB-13342]MBD2423369.1 DUF2721 domain-containing protein [Cyanobium sp. FACHB-13342]